MLDETDIRILKLLQENSRLSNKEIGQKLNKTASPIFQRIRKMQEMGYIKKYSVILDHKMIDRGFIAFTHIQLKDHSKESLLSFEQEIIRLPEVLECYHISGIYDFILRIAVKNLDDYHEFLMNKLFGLLAVGNVQSTFVMKEAKAQTAFPL